MPWTIMLITWILVFVYLITIAVFMNDIKEYSHAAQVIIVLAVSVVYIAGCYIYFVTKFPTLF